MEIKVGTRPFTSEKTRIFYYMNKKESVKVLGFESMRTYKNH